MLSTNTRWVRSTNISVDVANYGQIKKNSHCTFTFCLLQKMTCLDWTIYSWLDFSFWGCFFMLRTNCRCVQSPNISVDVAKFGENYHKYTQYTHVLAVTRNDLSSWTTYSWYGFNTLGYAMNKLQMCSVNQHQRRRRQMWIKFSQIHPVHSIYICYKKMTCLDRTIYSWYDFNSLGWPHMQRTNYICVQSPNISVDVAKCGKTLH